MAVPLARNCTVTVRSTGRDPRLTRYPPVLWTGFWVLVGSALFASDTVSWMTGGSLSRMRITVSRGRVGPYSPPLPSSMAANSSSSPAPSSIGTTRTVVGPGWFVIDSYGGSSR